MNYTNVLKVFNIEYEAIITPSKDTTPTVTLLSKNETPINGLNHLKIVSFVLTVFVTALLYTLFERIMMSLMKLMILLFLYIHMFIQHMSLMILFLVYITLIPSTNPIILLFILF